MAELRELELQQKRGTLLDAAAVEAEWQSLIATIRAGVLAVPTRVAPELVTLTDERQIEDAVTAAIHEAMQAITADDS